MSDFDVVRESWGMASQMAHIKRGVCESKGVKYEKNREVFLLRPALFKLYKSHTMSSEALDRPSLKLGRIRSILWLFRRHYIRLFFAGLMVGTIAYCVFFIVPSIPSMLYESLAGASIVDVGPDADQKPVTITSPVDSEVKQIIQKADDDQIIGFVRGGVITRRGILRKDDHITIDGELDFVSTVNVNERTVYLGSGKKVQK